MHGPAAGRRSSRAASRSQIMQRRLAALAIASAVIALAVAAACAIPTHGPVTMPQAASAGLFGTAAARPAGQVVVARLDGVDLLLPVPRDATTAIAFHPVDGADSVALAPAGEPAGDGGSVVADGVAHYFVMDSGGTAISSSTSGLDVGAAPGSPVLSPAYGRVAAVKTYSLLGRHADVEIDIRLATDPTLLLVITHVVGPRVHVGDQVAAGTVLGRLRGFPADVQQAIKRFTNDAGDHVQLVVMRTAPDLAGF
jgi:hypothetical protein